MTRPAWYPQLVEMSTENIYSNVLDIRENVLDLLQTFDELHIDAPHALNLNYDMVSKEDAWQIYVLSDGLHVGVVSYHIETRAPESLKEMICETSTEIPCGGYETSLFFQYRQQPYLTVPQPDGFALMKADSSEPGDFSTKVMSVEECAKRYVDNTMGFAEFDHGLNNIHANLTTIKERIHSFHDGLVGHIIKNGLPKYQSLLLRTE